MSAVPISKSPLPNCLDAPRGSWWRWSGEYVSIKCPQCGQCATLRKPDGGHDIAVDGTVSPSVVCPYAPCAWHVHVKLQDWDSIAV